MLVTKKAGISMTILLIQKGINDSSRWFNNLCQGCSSLLSLSIFFWLQVEIWSFETQNDKNPINLHGNWLDWSVRRDETILFFIISYNLSNNNWTKSFHFYFLNTRRLHRIQVSNETLKQLVKKHQKFTYIKFH